MSELFSLFSGYCIEELELVQLLSSAACCWCSVGLRQWCLVDV